jgi:hypothetical protein
MYWFSNWNVTKGFFVKVKIWRTELRTAIPIFWLSSELRRRRSLQALSAHLCFVLLLSGTHESTVLFQLRLFRLCLFWLLMLIPGICRLFKVFSRLLRKSAFYKVYQNFFQEGRQINRGRIIFCQRLTQRFCTAAGF